MTRHIGSRIATELTGDELFSFEFGLEKQITARDLRAYLGGDIAVPAFRMEAGANSRKISDLPNAEHPMGTGDLIPGLQNKENVNFSRAQILAPLVTLIVELQERCERLENLLQIHGLDK